MGVFHDFKPTLTTANQIRSVTVRGWDRRTKQPIKETVSLDDPIALVPTQAHCTAGKVQVKEAEDCLYYAPGLEDVQAHIDKLGLESLPTPPSAPDWMNSYDIQLITGGDWTPY